MLFSDLLSASSSELIAQLYVDSIREAHAANPAGWSLSQPTGRPRINLVAGRIFVLSLSDEALWITVDLNRLDSSVMPRLAELGIEGPMYEFASLPTARAFRVPLSTLSDAWPLLEEAHQVVIRAASHIVSRTPYFKFYAPDLVDDLEGQTGTKLPRPDFGVESDLTPARVQRLVDLLRRTYLDWAGFNDPRFEEDEVHYKQEVGRAAAESLSRDELERLLEAGLYDEFINRLDTIGKQTNLLYLSVPSSGDLNILYREDLPREGFCLSMFDLIHGDGDGAERLTRYLAWIDEQDIPRSHNKWTFPTYFLFFCHPEEEMLVKPSYVREFLQLAGFDFKLGSGPAGDTYAAIRGVYQELGDALGEYGPRDMIDLQGFVWVAVRANREARKRRDLIESARAEFKRLQEDPEFRFRVGVRHYRSLQLQELLVDPAAVTLDEFNREVWRILSSVSIDGKDVSGMFRRFGIDESESQLMLDAIEDGTLELHGNAMWGSGSEVYGPMLRLRYDAETPLGAVVDALEEAGGSLDPNSLIARVADFPGGADLTEENLEQLVAANRPYLRHRDGLVQRISDEEVREEFVQQAVHVLNDSSLDPEGKAESLMEIPGFGRNTATGLVMAFHPDEFGIYNHPSRNALESLGFEAKNLSAFESSLQQLREDFDAADFFELDQFLWMLDSGLIHPTRSGLWWVNQGQTYEQERELGCVWAGMAGEGKPRVQHHVDVSRMLPGDHVLHYASGALCAISTVTEPPSERSKDIDAEPGVGNPVGYFTPVDYSDLEQSIELEAIPKEWRMSEGGPFNKDGAVKQGYLYPITTEFAGRLRGRFDEVARLLPVSEERSWLFQANPDMYDLEKAVTEVEPGAEDSWYVSRYGDEMHEGDYVYLWQAGGQAGVYATGRIAGAVFKRDAASWRSDAKDGDKEPAVPFVYERILEAPISREEVLDDSILSKMQVVRAPKGTNFRITGAEHRRLQEMMTRGDGVPSLEDIVDEIERAGMRISDDILRRYHLSLQTRGFVILAGLSGSGKTWLTQLYAQAVGARFKLVPVAPNWTTNEDLLGFFNPITQKYHDTAFSRFLRDAAAEYKRATEAGKEPVSFHVTLDEMNLARVEYYFARFLSAMEIRARQRTATIELGPDDSVVLPPNLHFIGTVNIDETTHGFADKVYDRAQLIELEAPRELLKEHLGDFNYASKLLEIWDAVAELSPFAFRVLDEIEVYVMAAEEFGVSWQTALDEQVVQKVLPKLKGADPRIAETLDAIIHVAGDELPLTNAKAEAMAETLRDYGFTSYF